MTRIFAAPPVSDVSSQTVVRELFPNVHLKGRYLELLAAAGKCGRRSAGDFSMTFARLHEKICEGLPNSVLL